MAKKKTAQPDKHNFDFTDLKAAISSDATDENEQLKKKVAELEAELAKVKVEDKTIIDQQREWIKGLSNKCSLFTGPKGGFGYFMCMHCAVSECAEYHKANELLWQIADESGKKRVRPGTKEAANLFDELGITKELFGNHVNKAEDTGMFTNK